MGNVTFRRIKGHIVPIKAGTKSGKSSGVALGKGAALVGSGAAVAAVAGHISAGLVHDSAWAENESKVAMKISQAEKGMGQAKQAARSFRLASRNKLLAKHLFAQATKTRTVAAIGAAALIGAGIHTILKEVPGAKEHPKASDAVAVGSAGAAHFGIRAFYHGRLGRGSVGILSQAFRKAITRLP